jgi:uncharacterized repeat protein (TIGR03803 family)
MGAAGFVLPAQTLTTLHNFSGAYGGGPYAGLVQASNGNFYGTTIYGEEWGGRAAFEITPAGDFTALYAFCQDCTPNAGTVPYAGLVQSASGSSYGAAGGGGFYGHGAVFAVTTSGAVSAVYGFCAQAGCPDGNDPHGTLVSGSDGNLYGTTTEGGAAENGTVFQLTPASALKTLYSFCSQPGCADGSSPFAGLVQASDGNFYGSTQKGGAHGEGTVYRITPAGTLTRLYSFCSQSGCADGGYPKAALIEGRDGYLYGRRSTAARTPADLYTGSRWMEC